MTHTREFWEGVHRVLGEIRSDAHKRMGQAILIEHALESVKHSMPTLEAEVGEIVGHLSCVYNLAKHYEGEFNTWLKENGLTKEDQSL